MTETEKAYLAGFIDGEGSIGIYPDYRSSRNYRLVLTVSNTNKDVIDWIANIVGEKHSRQVKVKTTKDCPSWQGEKDRWKDCYSIWFGSGIAQSVLKEVFPYLIVKKQQATIAIEYPIGKYGKHITLETRNIKEECYKKMKPLNQTGPNKRGPKRTEGGDLG
jgi:hypothetical protein